MYNTKNKMSMDSIPEGLRYSSITSSQARVVRSKIQPIGINQGTDGTVVRFLLPQKSICDMRSLAIHYDYTISGLIDAETNYSNCYFPPTYQHWSNVKVMVSGSTAAGAQANHLDIAHHLLAKASVGEDYCFSRLNNGYDNLVRAPALTRNGEGGNATTTKTLYATYDDLVLFRSKSFCYDSSLLGNLEIEMTFSNAKSILKPAGYGNVDGDAAFASIAHNFANITLSIDQVVSISPLYVSLLSERLQVSQPIRYGFSEVRTTLVSNTGSNRITLQGECIDAVAVAFLNQEPNSNTGLVANTLLTTPNAPRYRFSLASKAASKNMSFQLTVGGEVFGRQTVNNLSELLDQTVNAMYGNDARSVNLLYAGLVNGATSYTLDNAWQNNAISITKFAVGQEGWATNIFAGLQTSGIQTDCVVNSAGAAMASHVFIAVLQSSQVVFDPQSSAVSIQA